MSDLLIHTICSCGTRSQNLSHNILPQEFNFTLSKVSEKNIDFVAITIIYLEKGTLSRRIKELYIWA